MAAASVAAAVLLFLGSSGGDGDSETPTNSPSETATPTPAATDISPTGHPGNGFVLGDVVDLASEPPTMTVLGKAEMDLVSGSRNVALGDFNDDSEPDLLFGAPSADGADGDRPDSGEAYVVFGPLEGELDLSNDDPDITIIGAADGDRLGITVFAGDLNDDGIDEIMVGAQNPSVPFPGLDARTQQGRLYIFYGTDELNDISVLDLADEEFDVSVTGAEGFSHLSTAIDIGDINGDGDIDILVSGPFAGRELGTGPGGQRTTVGEVYAIFGSDDGPRGEYNIQLGEYDVLFSGEDENGQFGSDVAVGDFNGDGTDDVVIGAHRSADPNGKPANGAAYVFYGGDDISGRLSISDGEQSVTIQGPKAGAALGFPVAAGDLNGDGIDDIIIGAQQEGVTGGNLATTGTVRVIFGGDNLPETIDLSAVDADLTIPGAGSGLLLPTALAVSDLDGDGIDDLVFTTALSGAARGRSSAGLAYTIIGSGSLPSSIDITSDAAPPPLIGPAPEARLGSALVIGEVATDKIGLALVAPGASAEEDGPRVGAIYIVRVDRE